VIIFQGIKKTGFGFQVKILLGLGFSLGCRLSATQPFNGLFLQCLLWRELHKKAFCSSKKWGPPPFTLLLPVFCCSLLFCCSSCFVTPLITLLFFFVLCRSSYFVASPLALSFLLFRCSSYFTTPPPVLSFFLLYYSFPCFTIPTTSPFFLLFHYSSVFCHSSYFAVLPCFIVPPTLLNYCSSCLAIILCFILLLFIVLRYYPLCFTTALVSVLFCAWLLLSLCYFYYFTTMGTSLLLHALLFSYHPRYLSTPCCFTTLPCFVAPFVLGFYFTFIFHYFTSF